MQTIDLNSPEYTALFEQAEIYVRKNTVEAVQVTVEGLRQGCYKDRDVRYDGGMGYVVDTYEMRGEYPTRTIGYVGHAILTKTSPIQVGDWLITRPPVWVGDRAMNCRMSDEAFREYCSPTNVDGVYRVKELIRIIPNPLGATVVVESPSGERRTGGPDCHFCATYDPHHPDDLASSRRFLLSDADFSDYGLASEVIGHDWQEQSLADDWR